MTNPSELEFRWPVRVYYEDTDSGGVVYHANYLRFMERTRTEWLRSLGFEHDMLRERENMMFAVQSAAVDYVRPARLNDMLEVSAALERRGRASLCFVQQVRRGGEVLCQGKIKVVSLDVLTFRPRPMPTSILDKLPKESE